MYDGDTRYEGPVTVQKLIEDLSLYPPDLEVGGWKYHFLPLRALSVETDEFQGDDGPPVKRQVLVINAT